MQNNQFDLDQLRGELVGELADIALDRSLTPPEKYQRSGERLTQAGLVVDSGEAAKLLQERDRVIQYRKIKEDKDDSRDTGDKTPETAAGD